MGSNPTPSECEFACPEKPKVKRGISPLPPRLGFAERNQTWAGTAFTVPPVFASLTSKYTGVNAKRIDFVLQNLRFASVFPPLVKMRK